MNRTLTIAAALATLTIGCGNTHRSAPAQRPLQFTMGAAHVAGAYSPEQRHAGRPTLMEGAELVQKLGGKTLKVYLTPDVADKYGDQFIAADSLTELAQSAAYTNLFAKSFDTFVLTTLTFSTGTNNQWRSGLSAEEAAAEEQEMYELTRHLLSTYQDRDVRFVLQNWEGDWALLGGFDANNEVSEQAKAGMIEWLSARQRGVERARAEVQSRATVYHAAEVNLVLDGKQGRVVRDVLPNVTVDAVSYSAWETLPEDSTVMNPGRVVKARMEKAFATIREAAPKAAVFIGEFGAPENEMNQKAVADVLKAATETATEQGAAGLVYWQIIDNECSGEAPVGCRGFWLTKPDGSSSLAASVLFAR